MIYPEETTGIQKMTKIESDTNTYKVLPLCVKLLMSIRMNEL